MTVRFISFMSGFALTALAGAASAGAMPAAGEQPYAHEYGASQSSATRAEVMAAAIATPPAAGEQDHVRTAASAPRHDASTVTAGLGQASGYGAQAESNEGE